MTQPVRMVFMKESVQRVKLEDRWQFKAKGRWRWFQEQVWRFLFKTGALTNVIDERLSYQEIYVDGDSLVHKVFQAKSRLLDIGRKPSVLLIGAKDWGELARSEDAARLMMQQGQGFSAEGRTGWNQELFNLSIRVVPWMEGFLILDDERA